MTEALHTAEHVRQAARSIRVAADVGGTLIDSVAVDTDSGRVWFDKQPASADSLVREFMTGLARMGISGAALRQLFHGTRVAINAVVQHRRARAALITTAGFGDVLELGRGGRPEVYNCIRGPALWCWSGQDPDADKVEVSWSDLARVLGRPTPYWPGRLRSPDLIADWQPRDTPARDVGKQDLDGFPLTRMTLQYPPEHVAHRALIHTAHSTHSSTSACFPRTRLSSVSTNSCARGRRGQPIHDSQARARRRRFAQVAVSSSLSASVQDSRERSVRAVCRNR